MSNRNTQPTDGANLDFQAFIPMIDDMGPRRAYRYLGVCFSAPEETEVRIPLCGFHAPCDCVHVLCAYYVVA